MRSAADIADVGCPDFAAALIRTESTRNCWPSSRRRSASCHARHSRSAFPSFAAEVTFGRGAQPTARALGARGQRLGRLALARDARDRRARSGSSRRTRSSASPPTRPSSRRPCRPASGTTSSCARSSTRSDDTKEVFFALAVEDIKRACDLLRPVWERTNGVDGFVSIEVDPDLAYERDATFEQAKQLHELVDRPNVYVKIPATEPGARRDRGLASPPAARSTSRSSSRSQRHAEVAEAYIRGLERLVEAGRRSGARDLRRELLRVAGRHRGRPSARGDRARRTSRDAWRSTTPSSRTSTTSRSSRVRAGTRWPRPARDRSAACGRRRRRRTRRTATSSTSRSSSGATPSTRCRSRPSPPSRTTASSRTR